MTKLFLIKYVQEYCPETFGSLTANDRLRKFISASSLDISVTVGWWRANEPTTSQHSTTETLTNIRSYHLYIQLQQSQDKNCHSICSTKNVVNFLSSILSTVVYTFGKYKSKENKLQLLDDAIAHMMAMLLSLHVLLLLTA